MDPAAISDIEEQLRHLRPDQLALVARFIRSLLVEDASTQWDMLLAAESSLRKDWEGPEEDAAWADL